MRRKGKTAHLGGDQTEVVSKLGRVWAKLMKDELNIELSATRGILAMIASSVDSISNALRTYDAIVEMAAEGPPDTPTPTRRARTK